MTRPVVIKAWRLLSEPNASQIQIEFVSSDQVALAQLRAQLKKIGMRPDLFAKMTDVRVVFQLEPSRFGLVLRSAQEKGLDRFVTILNQVARQCAIVQDVSQGKSTDFNVGESVVLNKSNDRGSSSREAETEEGIIKTIQNRLSDYEGDPVFHSVRNACNQVLLMYAVGDGFSIKEKRQALKDADREYQIYQSKRTEKIKGLRDNIQSIINPLTAERQYTSEQQAILTGLFDLSSSLDACMNFADAQKKYDDYALRACVEQERVRRAAGRAKITKEKLATLKNKITAKFQPEYEFLELFQGACLYDKSNLLLQDLEKLLVNIDFYSFGIIKKMHFSLEGRFSELETKFEEVRVFYKAYKELEQEIKAFEGMMDAMDMQVLQEMKQGFSDIQAGFTAHESFLSVARLQESLVALKDQLKTEQRRALQLTEKQKQTVLQSAKQDQICNALANEQSLEPSLGKGSQVAADAEVLSGHRAFNERSVADEDFSDECMTATSSDLTVSIIKQYDSNDVWYWGYAALSHYVKQYSKAAKQYQEVIQASEYADSDRLMSFKHLLRDATEQIGKKGNQGNLKFQAIFKSLIACQILKDILVSQHILPPMYDFLRDKLKQHGVVNARFNEMRAFFKKRIEDGLLNIYKDILYTKVGQIQKGKIKFTLETLLPAFSAECKDKESLLCVNLVRRLLGESFDQALSKAEYRKLASKQYTYFRFALGDATTSPSNKCASAGQALITLQEGAAKYRVTLFNRPKSSKIESSVSLAQAADRVGLHQDSAALYEDAFLTPLTQQHVSGDELYSSPLTNNG